jgi:glucokinase
VAISIGTGIGAGIVMGGELYTGAAGAAGEIPYLPLGKDPFDPDMHKRGPLEEAVAGRGIAREAARRLADGAKSELAANCSAADVFATAERGDSLALEIVDDQARTVSLAIAAVAAVVAPELVVLGGSIGANPLLLERVRRYAEQLTALPLPIERSALAARAALVGAIAYGLQEAQAMVLSPASETFEDEAVVAGGERG